MKDNHAHCSEGRQALAAIGSVIQKNMTNQNSPEAA